MKKWHLFLLSVILLQEGFAQNPAAFTVASYNVRYNNPGDSLNAWPHRKEKVKALIRFHEFDIFGTQEALLDQVNDIAGLTEYAHTGSGRDDGKTAGEHSAIFYKKERFRLLDAGDFWLSETPEQPGKGWDATCCNRICSWGKFRDLKTQKEFYFFNVHFDHRGIMARKESGKLMVKKIEEITKGVKTICVGDFNSRPETEQILKMQTILKDAYQVTEMPPYGPVGTTNGFKFDAPMTSRIDYVFVSAGIKVLKYGVLTDAQDQRYPSDHQPVMVKVLLP